MGRSLSFRCSDYSLFMIACVLGMLLLEIMSVSVGMVPLVPGSTATAASSLHLFTSLQMIAKSRTTATMGTTVARTIVPGAVEAAEAVALLGLEKGQWLQLMQQAGLLQREQERQAELLRKNFSLQPVQTEELAQLEQFSLQATHKPPCRQYPSQQLEQPMPFRQSWQLASQGKHCELSRQKPLLQPRQAELLRQQEQRAAHLEQAAFCRKQPSKQSVQREELVQALQVVGQARQSPLQLQKVAMQAVQLAVDTQRRQFPPQKEQLLFYRKQPVAQERHCCEGSHCSQLEGQAAASAMKKARQSTVTAIFIYYLNHSDGTQNSANRPRINS